MSNLYLHLIGLKFSGTACIIPPRDSQVLNSREDEFLSIEKLEVRQIQFNKVFLFSSQLYPVQRDLPP